MDASEIIALRSDLDRYLLEFDDCFGRDEPAAHFGTYVRGQLSDLPRKSVEPMAFHLKRDELPTRAHWLIVAQNVLEEAEVKYFVSNAPPGMPLEVMLHVAFSRWPIERSFEDQKTELGLDHFEVRNYRSLTRHLTITAVSFLFLARITSQRRGKKSRPDALPGPHRRQRDDPLAANAGATPTGIFAETS